ncbi:HD-GYP domain-containing protein [Roseateles cavernae]|uniref:HD-GYP domain-containing protein n=1 Tax=Roseateles cavernae TaxID=3153578 RepID=UPI0032E4D597
MIKRIHVDQLRLGMHVHEFCGSWMDHPFWRAKFMLRSETERQRVVSGGIKELWIDTTKGLDVEHAEGHHPVVTRQAVAEEVERELECAATMPMELDVIETGEAALAKAAALYRRSVPKITALFGEARLGKAISIEQCGALVDEISASVLHNPGALISVARLKRRDEYTYMHSVAVCALMVSLGRQLGLEGDQLKKAGLAGMLHDLGKALMPLDVLRKPGKLTDAEFEIMKSHPERGHELLLGGSGAGPLVLDVCLHHHEKIDGSGYPHGLVGEQISLFAKMGAVCDVYDAITSVRPYKSGWDPGESLRRMAQWKGHFEPRIFQAFVKTVGIYPIGSLVRLQSGRLAVVMSQDPRSLLAPKVKVFFSTKSNLRIEPQEIDLAGPWCQDKVIACESPDDWPFKDLNALWGAPRS